MKYLIGLLSLFVSALALAQVPVSSPIGAWKTIDDATGKEKAIVRISEAGGVLTGKIEKLFDATKDRKSVV